jgi:hypothetical protein
MSEKILSRGQLKKLISLLAEAAPADMSADVAQSWIMNPEALQKAVREALIPGGRDYEPLLILAGAITIKPALWFIVADNFDRIQALMRYVRVTDRFNEFFAGKTETAEQGETTLRYHALNHHLDDIMIFADLGDAARVEVGLAEVYALLAVQPNGEHGTLLNDGHANIFYVRDIKGVLRWVRVYWENDRGWTVDAYSVGMAPGSAWRTGDQVFSR